MPWHLACEIHGMDDLPALAVVCAWCKRTLAVAAEGAPVTHTICPVCVEWAMAHPLDIPPAAYGGYDDRRDVWDDRL